MKKETTRRDVIRVGGVIFASGAVGVLEAPNVTRGPYFVDDRNDSNITNDDVDSSIPQRSDIRSDTKGGTGTQSGLPLYLNITVGDYSSGACSAISGAQVHIWHLALQCTRRIFRHSSRNQRRRHGPDRGEFPARISVDGFGRPGELHHDLSRMVQRPRRPHSREGTNIRLVRKCDHGSHHAAFLRRHHYRFHLFCESRIQPQRFARYVKRSRQYLFVGKPIGAGDPERIGEHQLHGDRKHWDHRGHDFWGLMELVLQSVQFHCRCSHDHPRNLDSSLSADLSITDHLRQCQC